MASICVKTAVAKVPFGKKHLHYLKSACPTTDFFYVSTNALL